MSVTRISEFDTWRPGYADDSVRVVQADTDDLADIFTDEGLTDPADNPQTLITRTVDDVSYGRFAAPLYTAMAYQLVIESIDRTGTVRPPLVGLDDEDASKATVQVTGGTEDASLEDHLARRIDVRDFGPLVIVGGPGASAATNNASIVGAIGQASALGGGFVEMPAGTYAFTGFTLPQGVVLRGAGRVATTLQSTQASAVVTIGGSRAGLSRITLDGVTLVTNSIGVYAANKDEIVFDDVEIKRFATGLDRRGGARCNWSELYVSNCTIGYRAYGDDAAGTGAALSFNTWRGGKVELCGTTGIEFKYVDHDCDHNVVRGVTFDTNTGTAVSITGARATTLEGCHWTGNTVDLVVADASPLTDDNSVRGLEIIGGDMNGGTVSLTGTLELIAIRQMTIEDVTVTVTSPLNNTHVEDCYETGVTIAGDTLAWRRHQTGLLNTSSFVTTDDSFLKAWARVLLPGEHVFLDARIIGRGRDSTDYKIEENSAIARRPGSLLNYELQTANYTAGQTLTGHASGATALIASVADAGATGTLTLYDIVGDFLDDEIISDPLGGSATVNGALSTQDVVILNDHILAYDAQTANFTVGDIITGATTGSKAKITADTDAGATGSLTLTDYTGFFEDNETITSSTGGSATANGFAGTPLSGDFAQTALFSGRRITFFGNGSQIEMRVQGLAGHSLDWTVQVGVTSSR